MGWIIVILIWTRGPDHVLTKQTTTVQSYPTLNACEIDAANYATLLTPDTSIVQFDIECKEQE